MSPSSPEPPRERSLHGIRGLFPPGPAGGDAGGLCGCCSPPSSPRAACICDSGKRQRVPGRKCLHLCHPTIGFAIQEMAQCAQGAVAVMPPGGSHCCPFATPSSSDLPSAHLLFLRESPTTAGTHWLWEGSCQSRDRVGAARSDPVPWSLGWASALARVSKLGLGLAWG